MQPQQVEATLLSTKGTEPSSSGVVQGSAVPCSATTTPLAGANSVQVVPVATVQRGGPLITKQSTLSLGLMLAAQIVGLVATTQYTRAYSKPSESLLVCSEETGSCTDHYFTNGWCRSGSIVAYTSADDDLAGIQSAEPPGPCGPYDIEQACVTGANLQQCHALLAAGCNADDIVALESCPLQFDCMSAMSDTTMPMPPADVYATSSTPAREELPCPEGYVDPDVLIVEGVVMALLIIGAMFTMAAFPGACTCCVLGDGCSGRTTVRIVTYVVSLIFIVAAVLIGLSTGILMHQSELEPVQPGVFALALISVPLAAFGGLTLSRYISRTVEEYIADSTVARRNHVQCALIAAAVALVSIITPAVAFSSTPVEEAGDGYGYWGGGGGGPPRCQLAAVVQDWECAGCDGVLLRTLGDGGTPPDSDVSKVIAQWMFESVDAPEPSSTDGLGSIHAMYPWLNPTCADIGVHSGREYCRDDADALLALAARTSADYEASSSSRVPSQVPLDCVSWNDGCNTCSVDSESMVCSLAQCSSFLTPFCERFANGTTCQSAIEPGCDPSSHQGRIDYSDPRVQYEILSIAASWRSQCQSARADTCTAANSEVQCVVWEPEIVYGRPFLVATDHRPRPSQVSVRATMRAEMGSDWIMSGEEL